MFDSPHDKECAFAPVDAGLSDKKSLIQRNQALLRHNYRKKSGLPSSCIRFIP